jgi:hypothetical protein
MRPILALLLSLVLSACAAAQRPALEPSPARIGALAAQDLLGRRDFMRYDVGEVHALHYAEVAAAYGALRLAAATHDRALKRQILARYRRTTSFPNTLNHVDANVFGVWSLELSRQRLAGPADLADGVRMAEGQWGETGVDGLSLQARYWIDDVWMIGALQIEAWRATHRQEFLDRAALTARLYVARLQQPNGLFHHGPDAPFFWARGNGWVAAGLTEILSELPPDHPDYPAIVAGYRRMMAALLANQAGDGMWRQLIDHPQAWKETSGTAMFGYAMAVGVRRGILTDPAYGVAVRRAWAGLAGYVGPDGRLSQVCVGTGQSRDAGYYLGRPTVTGDLHGQAALLWFAAELAR